MTFNANPRGGVDPLLDTYPAEAIRAPRPDGSVLPPSERNHDEAREAYEEGLTRGQSRPLSGDEKAATQQDPGRGDRVYAPASERVAKAPAPGHQELVSHTDAGTPERRAAIARGIMSAPPGQAAASARAPEVHATGAGRASAGGALGIIAAFAGLLVSVGCFAVVWMLRAARQRERKRPAQRARRAVRRARRTLRGRALPVPRVARLA